MAAFTGDGMEGKVKVKKGLRILRYRLAEQGIWTTVLWALDHIVRRITGAPIEKVSRVSEYLHVGGQYKKRGWKLLKKRGIGSVVNLRIEYDDREHGIAPERYLHLPTVDDTPPTFEHLEEGADFIQECIDQGVGVYIHCKSGIGRAPSMAAAYLIYNGMGYEEAVDALVSKRPFIRMVKSQKENLKAFERYLAKKAGSRN